jgi:hypothetical protein
VEARAEIESVQKVRGTDILRIGPSINGSMATPLMLALS